MELKFIAGSREELIQQIEDFLGGPTGGSVTIAKGAGKAPTGGTKTPPVKKITADQIREAIAPVGSPADKKALFAEFENAEGQPCAKISELQEADYPAILARIAEKKEELDAMA